MSHSVAEESNRRRALGRMMGLAAVPMGLPLLARLLGVDGIPLLSPAYAAGEIGVQPGQGDVMYVSGDSALTTMIAEWTPGDVNDGSRDPFRIAASKTAFEKAPADAARYEAKLYNFPSGSLRRLTFKKGGPVNHLITFETELYVLSGSAILTPMPSHPGKPVKVSAGDALFLPTGHLSDAAASEDFVVLQAFVGRTVREAKKAIITAKQAVASEIAVWDVDGKHVRATAADDIRKAPKTACRISLRNYATNGNIIRVATLRGGRCGTVARNGSDALVYVAKGKVRRNEGDRTFELAAGDCVREKVGNPGFWEPLEETMLIATDAPMNPAMLPPIGA